ncbi:endonuclease [Rossellomorea sp. BNER]|uniref:endonuclease n=1 Tax=Rossellomorea sp. BNER TaxID=2962031 RepID=UPI003AF213D3
MNNSLSTPNTILNMLTGKLLGDGCITKQKGRKPRFQFIHSITDKEWCFYCYEKLKHTLPLALPYYKNVKDTRTIKGYTECFQVQSRTDPIISLLESLWYINRVKVIPFSFLEQNLNELALAWWYQDDGHLSQKDNKPKKVILSTDNFTPSENRRLIVLLARKYSLYFKLDSQNRLILYDQLQIFYFLRIVDPYIHSSMNRKIYFPQETPTNRKRTTIYLPKSIHLKKPTAEINKQLFHLHVIKEIIMSRTGYIDYYKKVIAPIRLIKETKGYQIFIHEQYIEVLQSIRNYTGLTMSQIITLCFMFENQ